MEKQEMKKPGPPCGSPGFQILFPAPTLHPTDEGRVAAIAGHVKYHQPDCSGISRKPKKRIRAGSWHLVKKADQNYSLKGAKQQGTVQGASGPSRNTKHSLSGVGQMDLRGAWGRASYPVEPWQGIDWSGMPRAAYSLQRYSPYHVTGFMAGIVWRSRS